MIRLRKHEVDALDKICFIQRNNGGVRRFLSQHSESLGPLSDMTVEQLGWAHRDVISVTPELAAIDAMRKMHEANIGAVAVIGDGGKLIGNFSVSELRCARAV